ncbi:uncharacterized protein FIBRA_07279 [Fibroporia radiculosa]|uniref:Rad21/Rec8-like protein N-terminal domain-containing protein n=1 Tax=Fibroporia radiculosa TaxID=599839 RepID=J4GE01_9APHY|nr:uncharacterized protein FIBRA_07279 [Fibroporia radiculosa]CCM05073.1 predicted protein [Fibroporia radiculosa]
MERKLSKTQTLQTDIEQSVDAIMGQEVEVMALRLSGQLLLGVVRIYSRKAKYLLDDCNEALLKIKMAFRPGVVDMTEDQLAVNRNAITLQGNNLDLDALLPDINWDMDFEERPVRPGGQHIARAADITLATANDYQFDFDDPGYGFDLGPSDGIGSQDYAPLGIDFGEGPVSVHEEESRVEDDTMSIEVGRDAAAPRSIRESLGSHLLGRPGGDLDVDLLSVRSRSREASEHPFGGDVDMNFGMDFGPDAGGEEVDLGISFELGDLGNLGEQALTPQTPRLTPSRASSPLTEPPQTPPPDVELTPRVDVQEGKARKRRDRKQIIDVVTELADGPGARVGRGRNAGLGSQMTQDVSGIVTENQYIPRSPVVMRLLEIRDDPIAHFLPTRTTATGTFFCAAPPGMVPELAELFMRPVQSLVPPKRRAEPADKPSSKRPRLEGSVAGDDEIEQVRRATSVAPSVVLGSEVIGRSSVAPDIDFGDHTGIVEDFQLPEFEMATGAEVAPERARSKSLAPSELSRLTTPPPEGVPMEDIEESYADVECPIAVFDDRATSSQSGESAATASEDGKGYSKNTVKALTIVRRDLQPTVGEEHDEEKVMSFKRMSEKASRRAASSFFFELLVLGTRDCVKLSQAGPFENIEGMSYISEHRSSPQTLQDSDPEYDTYKRGAFLEKTNRFLKDKSSEVPGPGTYNTDNNSAHPKGTSGTVKPNVDRYALLQRKVEELERIHNEGKKTHHLESERLKLELSRAQRTNTEHVERADKLKKQNDVLEARLQDLKKSNGVEQNELRELRTKLKAVEHERAQLATKQGEASDMKKALQVAEAKRRDDLRERDKRIAELEKAFSSEKKRREMAEAKLTEVKVKVDAEKQEIRALASGRS